MRFTERIVEQGRREGTTDFWSGSKIQNISPIQVETQGEILVPMKSMVKIPLTSAVLRIHP